MQPTGFEPDPAYTYASAGFAVADPDYLGLGTGPGLQPWMDVPSETTAALDMLRAVRGYLVSHGRTVRRDVMVTGFSQGASPALGLGRALQDRADPWFRLGALAPVSGVYDFAGAELPAVLDGDLVRLNPDPQLGAKYSVLYTALTLVAFDRVHRIYRSPSEVFQAPYAALQPVAGADDSSNAFAAGYTGPVSAIQPVSNPAIVETWHTATYQNSFASLVAGSTDLKYKLTSDNFVHLSGRLVTPSGVAASSTIATLPAGYQPARSEPFNSGYNQNSSPNASTAVIIVVGTGGAITVFNASAGTALNIRDGSRSTHNQEWRPPMISWPGSQPG
jgi:hypothetical protein